MNDYDVFIVPEFKLDSNYNYEIKLIVDSKLTNQQLFNELDKLDIKEYKEFNGYTKLVYYTTISCLVDLKKWLLQLAGIFSELGIKSNLDNKLVDKAKDLKK